MFVAFGIQHTIRMRFVLSESWPALKYFPTLSHKGYYFRKSYWTQNVFWFSLTLFCETFLILRRTEWSVIKNVHWSSGIVYYCQTLMKLEFSQQIFEKYSNIKYYGNSSSGCQGVPCGQTDGQKGVMRLTAAYRIKTHWTQNRSRNMPGYSRSVNKN